MLAEHNPWWKDKHAIDKDYDILRWQEKRHRWVPAVLNKISFSPFALHFILGPRQAGKTTALKILIKNLLNEKEPKSLFYFNCEMLSDYKELLELIKTYLEFRGNFQIKSSVIFLDEVTSPKEWYRAIKYLIDEGKLKNDVILLTGSSSISIKKQVELFPGRRGKGRDFVIMPLSFREFVSVLNPKLHQKVEAAKNLAGLETAAAKAMLYLDELDKELKKYMAYGGFPLGIEAISNNKEDAKRIYLNWIKNAVLKAERSDIIARQIMKAIIERMPSAISWEKISKEIEIKSPKTVAAYTDLLKSMFALVILYNIDISSKKIKFGKNKKIHLIDPLLLEIFEDWCLVKVKSRESVLAESIVASHLARMFSEQIFFWKNGFEIDVLVADNSLLRGFEVKWSEKSQARQLPQLKSFAIITKNEFSKKPLKIPLSIFLMLLDIE